jgi:hypothetical protein
MHSQIFAPHDQSSLSLRPIRKPYFPLRGKSQCDFVHSFVTVRMIVVVAPVSAECIIHCVYSLRRIANLRDYCDLVVINSDPHYGLYIFG